MANNIRINHQNGIYSVYEVDKEGAYVRVLVTSIEPVGKVMDLTEMLYYGKDLFTKTIVKFRELGMKGFYLHYHSDLLDCIDGLHNIITLVNNQNEEDSDKVLPKKYYEFEFI